MPVLVVGVSLNKTTVGTILAEHQRLFSRPAQRPDKREYFIIDHRRYRRDDCQFFSGGAMLQSHHQFHYGTTTGDSHDTNCQ